MIFVMSYVFYRFQSFFPNFFVTCSCVRLNASTVPADFHLVVLCLINTSFSLSTALMSQARYPGSEAVSDSEHRRLLNASLSSISSLMGLQLFSRLFTFALNQASSRLASPQVFGTAAIQFEFLLSTILFLSREGVRNAILRSSQSQNLDRELTANLAFLPFILGWPLMFLTTYIYGQLAGESTRIQPHFGFATWLYAFAAMIELLSEPMHAR
jgi:hypothetical protein